MRYFHKGKVYRESTGETDSKKAEKKLKDKLAEIRLDKIGKADFVPNTQVTVADLLDALEADYKLRGLQSLKTTLSHLKPVRAALGRFRAQNLTSEMIDRYIETRLRGNPEEKVKPKANGSVNRETRLLAQAYNLAIKTRRLRIAPIIRRLSERGCERRGFFEKAEFSAFVEHLPEYLRGFAQFDYRTGLRKKEIKSLQWSDVDMLARIVRLQSGNAKTGEGGVLALEGELWQIIERQWKMRQFERKDKTIGVSLYVFHKNGKPIGDFRKAWDAALKNAGLPQLPPKHPERKTFHPFRRTAVRDMTRAHVPERVAMAVTGHKTRDIFDRYNIVNEDDLREAALRTEKYLEALPTKQIPEMPEPERKNLQ